VRLICRRPRSSLFALTLSLCWLRPRLPPVQKGPIGWDCVSLGMDPIHHCTTTLATKPTTTSMCLYQSLVDYQSSPPCLGDEEDDHLCTDVDTYTSTCWSVIADDTNALLPPSLQPAHASSLACVSGSQHRYPWRHPFKVLKEGLWPNMKMRGIVSKSF
jgi:hypothetical protein